MCLALNSGPGGRAERPITCSTAPPGGPSTSRGSYTDPSPSLLSPPLSSRHQGPPPHVLVSSFSVRPSAPHSPWGTAQARLTQSSWHWMSGTGTVVTSNNSVGAGSPWGRTPELRVRSTGGETQLSAGSFKKPCVSSGLPRHPGPTPSWILPSPPLPAWPCGVLTHLCSA